MNENAQELTERLQAQHMANTLAIRVLLALNPEVSGVLRHSTRELKEFLLQFPLTDAQIAEAHRWMEMLTAPLPPSA